MSETHRDCEHGQLARKCYICELEQELAAVRAELERALVVVQAAVAYAKADGPEAMMPLLSLEHAVSAWKAGR